MLRCGQVVVPKALYCNKQVLIMQYLRGESLVKALQVRQHA